MIVDLHNHTKLCNHAKGTMSQYVDNAIKNGVKYFGFSDHAPMKFDQKYRMKFSDMKSYEKNVLDIKMKYIDEIDILLAYEVDYIKGFLDDRVLNANVDYLIGSVHFIEEWGFDNPEFIGNYKNQDIDLIWQKYFNTIEDMANSNFFDIVGHFDLIKVFKFMPNKNVLEIANNALHAIKKSGMSIELNVAGLRKPIKEVYPSLDLLKASYELDIPITFSSDAHAPEQVGLFSDEVVRLAKKVGYNECVYYKNREKKFIDF